MSWMNQNHRIDLTDKSNAGCRKVIGGGNTNAPVFRNATSKPKPGAVVRADLKAQTITLESDTAAQLTIRLNDQMLDLDKPVIVKSGDKTLHSAGVKRMIGVLSKTLKERGDPKSTFTAEIVVTPPGGK